MRCSDPLKCIGAIVGKAMEPLKDQKGVIKVLVTLRSRDDAADKTRRHPEVFNPPDVRRVAWN
jgi:hypothetical protein